MTDTADRILTLNGGSSSVKFALFAPQRVLSGAVERVGSADAFLRVATPGRPEERHPRSAADAAQAATGLIDWLDATGELAGISAVGHRVVHDGLVLVAMLCQLAVTCYDDIHE